MNNHMDNRPDGNRPNRNNPGNQGPNKNRQSILAFLICLSDFAGMLKFCDRYDERFVQ